MERNLQNESRSFFAMVPNSSLLKTLLIVVPLALVLRLWGIDREPVWLDEVYSVQLSTGSTEQILVANARDVHPPTYYLGLHHWRAALGSTAASLRGHSVFWSLLGVLFTVLLAQSMGLKPRFIALAGLLVAISALDIYFAQEARMYAQTATLATVSTYCLWRWLTGLGQTQSSLSQGIRLALYVVTAALLLQTMYLGIFVLLSQGLYVIARLATQRDLKGLLAYVGGSLTTVLLCLPWLSFMRANGPHKLGRLDWISKPGLEDLLSPLIRELFVGRIANRDFLSTVLLILAAGLFLATFCSLALPLRALRSREPEPLFLAWMTLAPMILAFTASHLLRPVYFRARFPVLVLPMFLILVAVAAMRMPSLRLRRSYVILVLIVMGGASLTQYRQITKPGMAEFAQLYHRQGPPDHVVLLPPSQTITASYHLSFRLENANQQQIEHSLDSGREVVIWVGVKEGYWRRADPRVKKVFDWLLELGPAQRLGVVDRMELWQITARSRG